MFTKHYLLSLLVCLIGFSQTSLAQYQLNGDATQIGDDCYQLTSEAEFLNGTVWYTDQLDLNESFDIEFIINLGSNDANGADGMVFVLQTVGTSAIGESGGGIGFEGFEPSFGIEFDTWENADFFDLVDDHVAIISNGDPNHGTVNNLAGPVPMLAGGANAEDGQDHVVRIEWNADTQTVDVYIDCELTVSLDNYDLVNDIFLGDPNVWFGFTGATGGSVNVQTVCLSENILEVSADQAICAGEEVQLFAGGSTDGTYEWTPATGLSATDIADPIANPLVSTSYVVTFNNLCGFISSDTIEVNVEACFVCEAEAGFFPGPPTSICEGEELTATSENFNTDSLYAQTYFLATPASAGDLIVAIDENGEFGEQPIGAYLVFPVNYAIADSIDFDFVGQSVDDFENNQSPDACYAIGLPFTILVDECIVLCDADGGAAESTSPLCSGSDINATSSGFNGDILYGQTHILVQDNTIVAIEDNGEFGAQATGNYEIYPCNFAIDDAPDFSIIGQDLEDLTNQTACFDLGASAEVAMLSPIDIDVDYNCDDETGIYFLTFAFDGGLPAFDNTTVYEATGELNGEFFISENNHTLTFADAAPYELNLVDEAGCTANTSGVPESCLKVAIQLISFEGEKLKEENLLTWQTATETEGDYFVLEKSFDGLSFAPIATINGRASNTQQSYRFSDKEQINTKAFYRLLSYEAGAIPTNTSNVILLERQQSNFFELQTWSFHENLNAKLNSDQTHTIQIQLIAMDGKVVFASTQTISAGTNNVQIPAAQMTNGLYLLQIDNGVNQIRERVLKY